MHLRQWLTLHVYFPSCLCLSRVFHDCSIANIFHFWKKCRIFGIQWIYVLFNISNHVISRKRSKVIWKTTFCWYRYTVIFAFLDGCWYFMCELFKYGQMLWHLLINDLFIDGFCSYTKIDVTVMMELQKNVNGLHICLWVTRK